MAWRSQGSQRDAVGRERLLYIGGAGHSGSTLLSLLLSNHPDIQSLGEVHRIGIFLREARETCTCGVPLEACPFWTGVDRALTARLAMPPDQSALRLCEFMLWPNREHPALDMLEKAALVVARGRLGAAVARATAPAHAVALRNSLALYAAVREVTGRTVVVDSSKDARRLKALYLADPARFRVLHAVRDGRAVAASAMRRRGWGMAEAAAAWVLDERRQRAAMRGIPRERILEVTYEGLCRDPEGTLAGVARFLDRDPMPGMARLRKGGEGGASHDVSGNLMRFRHGEQTIELDEKWRTTLSAEDLATFDRVAGRTLRRLGYR